MGTESLTLSAVGGSGLPRKVPAGREPQPGSAVPAVPVGPEPARTAELVAAVDEINRTLAARQHELAFSVDEESGRTVVRVVDTASGEVLRQVPAEELLRLARSLRAGEDPVSLGLERWT